MHVEARQLKAFLLDAGLVKEKDLNEAETKAKKSKEQLGRVLVTQGLLTEEQLTKMQAYILGIPFVNLTKEKIDPSILKIIPEPIAKSHNIVAFRKKGNTLEVAMADPDDLATIDFIKKKANLKILPRLTTIESIKYILQRTSDIHIEPTEKEVVVRYRIDGVLRDAMVLPKQAASGIVARIKVLSNLKLDEHRLPQDGRFKIESDEYKYSARVSILPVFDGEKVVMRLLSEGSDVLTLEQLGFYGDALEHMEKSLKSPVGMILVTGPTGSGKTTTLYTAMDILNTPEVNISTVEDPIEYRMPRVNQTQINAKIGLTFASGLRSLLRQDPDVLMVGEIRDKETVQLAINAALTGHLVLSTLHTTNAAGSIPRLLDMGAEPFLISSTLNIIIAQRLVRKLCENKEEYKLSAKELEEIAEYCNIEKVVGVLREQRILTANQTLEDASFYKPKKSAEYPDGYKGRVGIYELLPVNETIKELIVQRTTSDKIQAQAEKEGMITMVEDGLIKAAQGFTSIEEVFRVIME